MVHLGSIALPGHWSPFKSAIHYSNTKWNLIGKRKITAGCMHIQIFIYCDILNIKNFPFACPIFCFLISSDIYFSVIKYLIKENI